jgi:hypothetical protein
VILDTLSAKRACEEAHAVRLPNGVLHKLSLWLWRRWLLLLGAVSGTAAAALDFINGFEIGRRIVAVLLLLIGY